MRNSIIFIGFFLVSGCAALQELGSIEKPQLSVSDVNITDFSLQDVELTFDVDVENPNRVGINLSSYDFDFLIDQNSFVKGNQPLSTEIKSLSSSTVQVPVRFTFQDLYNTFSGVKDKDETAYEFDAVIGVDLPVLGNTKVPIKKSGTLPVVKAPKISAGRLNVKNISFTKADLELELNIDNPNAFGISLSNLDYQIDINGIKSITGNESTAVEIDEKTSGTIKVPISLNFLEAGRTAYNILTENEPIEYTLTGSTIFNTTLPFFDASAYDFNRSGTVNIFNN